METIILNEETQLTERNCATIGFFDGVHRGHSFLIRQLKELAERLGERSMVITFERHPRQVINPEWQPQLLTTLKEKERLVSEAGVDVMVVLRFDAAMAALSAREFMERVLRERLNVDTLLTGYDNRFGHGRTEGFEDYVGYGRQTGVDVVRAEALTVAGCAVSSSRIRRLLGQGDVAEAAVCLGRRYELWGKVVHGEQIGRRIGFPTANIEPDDGLKQLPGDGVYAVQACIEGNSEQLPGVMNIGWRPTFEGHRRTLEVHLLDFTGDVYGRRLGVEFVERLRGERQFESAEELTRQMGLDAEAAREGLRGLR